MLRGAVATGALLWLTGCITTRSVNQVVRAQKVMNATREQLNNSLAQQYSSIKTLQAAVEIKVTTGGQYSGQVKELPSFAGYILMRQPNDLRVFLQVPVVRSLGLDMVSNGKDFTLVIPPKNKAYTGEDHEVETPTKGLEALRPYIIRDALLVPPLGPGEIEAATQGARILPPAKGKKQATEEPDYDLDVVRPVKGSEAEAVRVIHISRVTLQPYEQDVYDHTGRRVTVVTYEGYKPFGDTVFPTVITVSRPLDELTLQITVNKLTLNQTMDDEQFVLKIPDGIAVTKMDSKAK